VSPLRGRDSERAEVGRLVAAAADGGGGVVIVEGAAGIGKSRLLAEAAQIAAGRQVQVAAGISDELDQVTPWAPLLQALSSTTPMLVSEADLAPLRALADQRLAVIDCIRAALEQAGHRRPLLIIVDDLQWPDPATLLALGSLPAQLFSFPVAWILARRPLPASAQLQSLIARLADTGAVRLHLGPLDADAAAQMAADALGAARHRRRRPAGEGGGQPALYRRVAPRRRRPPPSRPQAQIRDPRRQLGRPRARIRYARRQLGRPRARIRYARRRPGCRRRSARPSPRTYGRCRNRPGTCSRSRRFSGVSSPDHRGAARPAPRRSTPRPRRPGGYARGSPPGAQ
jgi:hypothetical protein